MIQYQIESLGTYIKIILYIYRFKYINISTVKFNKLTLTIFWFKKLNFCETFQTSDVLTLYSRYIHTI